MNNPQREWLTLAVYPHRRGLSFVLLSENKKLRVYGRRWILGDKHRETLSALVGLLERFQPGRVVIEDGDDPTSRRTHAIKKLLRQMATTCRRQGLVPQLLTRPNLAYAFRGRDCANKDDRAALIAQLYPSLQRRLPPRRELWTAESESMGVFDAMCLALSELGVPEEPVEDENERIRRLSA